MAGQRPHSARELHQKAGATSTRLGRCGAHSVVRQCRAAGALRSRAFGVASHLVGFLGGPRETGWAQQPVAGAWPISAVVTRLILEDFSFSALSGNFIEPGPGIRFVK